MKKKILSLAYKTLISILKVEKFNSSKARTLAEMATKNKKFLNGRDFSFKFISLAHKEYQKFDEEGEKMEWKLAQQAFEDFLPFMSDPDMLKFINDILIGTFGYAEDLFSCVTSIKLLGKDEKGPAVITITVSSFELFKERIEGDKDTYPYCHLSIK